MRVRWKGEMEDIGQFKTKTRRKTERRREHKKRFEGKEEVEGEEEKGRRARGDEAENRRGEEENNRNNSKGVEGRDGLRSCERWEKG